MKKISLILLVLFFIVLSSCSNNKSKEEGKNKVKTVEENILSELVINEDLGVSYQVPLKWELMSAELTERSVARLESENFEANFIVYQPEAFYFNSAISGLLRIGSVSKSQKSTEGKLTIDRYIQYYQKYSPNKDFKLEKFQVNNLNITQLVIEKSNLISFKNIFLNKQNKIIQFDFSLKKGDYEKEKKVIDAALASIKIL